MNRAARYGITQRNEVAGVVGRACPVARIAAPAGQPTTPEGQAGDTKINPKEGLTYVWIPPGDNACFDDEEPAARVTLANRSEAQVRPLPVIGLRGGYWGGDPRYVRAPYPGEGDDGFPCLSE